MHYFNRYQATSSREPSIGGGSENYQDRDVEIIDDRSSQQQYYSRQSHQPPKRGGSNGYKHNLPYDQNRSRVGPGALSNTAFGNYKNSMQTMPTAKSLGMSTSSTPYIAPKRLNTLKQSTLSSPSPKMKIGFQTQFQKKKLGQSQNKKEISQTVDEMDENQFSSRHHYLQGSTPQIIPRRQQIGKPPGPGGYMKSVNPVVSARALYKLNKLENKEQDEVEQEDDEESSPEQQPDPNQKLKEEFKKLQQELESLKKKKKLTVVDDDFKGSFLSRSASPVRPPKKKKKSPIKPKYRKIEVVETQSLKKPPNIGSLTVKNVSKKQTWMGRRKSEPPEEFKGSFQNKGKKNKKFESEESFEYYPPVQQSRLKTKEVVQPPPNPEPEVLDFSQNQIILQYQQQIQQLQAQLQNMQHNQSLLVMSHRGSMPPAAAHSQFYPQPPLMNFGLPMQNYLAPTSPLGPQNLGTSMIFPPQQYPYYDNQIQQLQQMIRDQQMALNQSQMQNLTHRSNFNMPSEVKRKESPRRVKIENNNVLSGIKENTQIQGGIMKESLKVPLASQESVETYEDINIISDLDMTNEGKRQTISRIDFNNQTENNSGIFLPPEKGSFAPSPDKIEQMEKYDKIQDKKSQKNHHRVTSNEFLKSESPDFTQTRQRETFEDYMIPEKEFFEPPEKQERLLVIGFDDKPRGKNPLTLRKSPMNIKPDFSPSPIATFPPKKLTLEKKTLPRQFEESEPTVLDTQILTPPSVISPPTNKRVVNADLLIADEMPNLQELAKRKFLRNVQSPQPRKSIALNNNNNQQNDETTPFTQRQEKSQQPTNRQNKTKEELAALRNQMMKSKFKDRQQRNDNTSIQLPVQPVITETSMNTGRTPNENLMARLASGSKASVDVKEMKRLTEKNYGKLPEIVRKKEQEKKQEEQAAKRARAAAYQKELDQRIRMSNKNKKKGDSKSQLSFNAK